ncbi:MAG: hypothetical protein WC587_00795 [Candidatus Paceibacterota bacterium]
MKDKISQFLPSKNFIISISLLLLVGIGGFWVLNKKGFEKTRELYPESNIFTALFSGDKQKDTDNDGLKDWEEALWRTDINNPDTDGDGTLDGEEVKLGRDPLKKGPDDKISPSALTTDSGTGNSLTENFGIKIFSDYISAKSSFDSMLSEREKNNLADSWMSDLSSLQEKEKTSSVYKIGDIKISQDNSTEAIKKYGNEVGAIINKYAKPIPPSEHELSVFQAALEAENGAGLEKLGARIDVYNNLTKNALVLQVPKNISLPHLSLTNSFSGVADGLKKMKEVFDDPVLGMAGFNQYQDSAVAMADAIRNINDFFDQRKIIFNKDEAGYIFRQIKENL